MIIPIALSNPLSINTILVHYIPIQFLLCMKGRNILNHRVMQSIKAYDLVRVELAKLRKHLSNFLLRVLLLFASLKSYFYFVIEQIIYQCSFF